MPTSIFFTDWPLQTAFLVGVPTALYFGAVLSASLYKAGLIATPPAPAAPAPIAEHNGYDAVAQSQEEAERQNRHTEVKKSGKVKVFRRVLIVAGIPAYVAGVFGLGWLMSNRNEERLYLVSCITFVTAVSGFTFTVHTPNWFGMYVSKSSTGDLSYHQIGFSFSLKQLVLVTCANAAVMTYSIYNTAGTSVSVFPALYVIFMMVVTSSVLLFGTGKSDSVQRLNSHFIPLIGAIVLLLVGASIFSLILLFKPSWILTDSSKTPSEPAPAEHATPLAFLFGNEWQFYQTTLHIGFIGRIVSMLYRLDIKLKEEQKRAKNAEGDALLLRRNENTGGVIVPALFSLLFGRDSKPSIFSLSYSSLAIVTTTVLLFGLPQLTAHALISGFPKAAGNKPDNSWTFHVLRLSASALAPLVILTVISVLAWIRGEWSQMWKYEETWGGARAKDEEEGGAAVVVRDAQDEMKDEVVVETLI